MQRFFTPFAVGTPALAVISAGGIIFFAAMLKARRESRAAGGMGAASRRSGVSAAGIALQMMGFFAAGVGGLRPSLPATSAPALLQAALVAALMLPCVLLFLAATRAMGANWSVVARMRAGHELVTSGIFAHLRHPIYTGMALFLLALALAFGHLANLVAALPLFAAGTGIRVRAEERLLRAEFGGAYDHYESRVKRFLPGVI
jgi:protein-S-isoprenylcysteine O-methyltransferase Ste14